MEQRLYDLIFIARPATPEEDLKKILTVIETACHEKGGKIEKTEHWLRVLDTVIKYQTIRLDEDVKLQKKLSGKREKRAARRPRRTTPTPAPAAAAPPAAPEQAAPAS